MRIGFVLARFTMLSLGTAVLDNLIFSGGIRVGLDSGVSASGGACHRGAGELSAGAEGSVLIEGAALVHAGALSRLVVPADSSPTSF